MLESEKPMIHVRITQEDQDLIQMYSLLSKVSINKLFNKFIAQNRAKMQKYVDSKKG
ncbi:MAG: hypothetical protein WC052_05205 [Patescibacteria group bacterium]